MVPTPAHLLQFHQLLRCFEKIFLIGKVGKGNFSSYTVASLQQVLVIVMHCTKVFIV